MNDYFGFGMMGNYEERLVSNSEIGNAIIDTCMVTDSFKPYETAIKHPCYREGEYVVVELYDTKEEASDGHKEWVDLFSKETLPSQLIDVNETQLQSVVELFGHSFRGAFEYTPIKKDSKP